MQWHAIMLYKLGWACTAVVVAMPLIPQNSRWSCWRSTAIIPRRTLFPFFISLVVVHNIRPSLPSPFPPSRNFDPGSHSVIGSALLLLHYGSSRHFCRAKTSALSFFVDSHRIAPSIRTCMCNLFVFNVTLFEGIPARWHGVELSTLFIAGYCIVYSSVQHAPPPSDNAMACTTYTSYKREKTTETNEYYTEKGKQDTKNHIGKEKEKLKEKYVLLPPLRRCGKHFKRRHWLQCHVSILDTIGTKYAFYEREMSKETNKN